MIIKTKSQAADQGTHGPILLAAWETGETSVTVGGKEYEFVREVEPVAMWAGKELVQLYSVACKRSTIMDHRNALLSVRDAVLARRVEMLREMGSEGIVESCATAINRHNSEDALELIIALIREHIEANRPVLTDEIVSGWYGEFCEKSARRFSVDDACQYVAHRAAEYRSPVVAELRAENERLETHRAYHAGEATRLDKENLELRAENERLKGEAEKTKGRIGVWMKTAKSLSEGLDALKSSQLPQPVDDSDKYGILVQDGCVALVYRDTIGWNVSKHVGGAKPLSIDPARIFKVTSQPPGLGPLKVPSDSDIKRFILTDGGFEARKESNIRLGIDFAIKWIKKANGAE